MRHLCRLYLSRQSRPLHYSNREEGLTGLEVIRLPLAIGGVT
jgi:hypothetical protein